MSSRPSAHPRGATAAAWTAVVFAFAVAFAPESRAEDAQPPPWQRFVQDTTFQAWAFPRYSDPNANFIAPDGALPAPPPNYSNPYPAVGVNPTAERTPNTEYVPQVETNPPPNQLLRLDLVDLKPAGANNNPPAGQLVLRGQTLRPANHRHVDLSLQYTYGVGTIGGQPITVPQTFQASDQMGNQYVLQGVSEVVLADGFINRRELYSLDLPANAMAGEGGAFEIRLQSLPGAHALLDDAIIDTRTLVPEPGGVAALAALAATALLPRRRCAGAARV